MHTRIYSLTLQPILFNVKECNADGYIGPMNPFNTSGIYVTYPRPLDKVAAGMGFNYPG